MIDDRTADRLRERARPLGPAHRRAMEEAICELARLDWNGATSEVMPAAAASAARQVERALKQWPDALRQAAADGVSESTVRRALVDWLLRLPLPLPLRLGPLLRDGGWPDGLPVGLGCWVLARCGPRALTHWLLRPPVRDAASEGQRLMWFCRVARAMTAPPPLRLPERKERRSRHISPADPLGTRAVLQPGFQPESQSEARPQIRPETRPESLHGFTRSRPPDDALMASVQGASGVESAARLGPDSALRQVPASAGTGTSKGTVNAAPAPVQHQNAMPPGSDAGPVEPVFHFLLQGEATRRDAMRENSQAELHFRLGELPAEVLATVHHAALDAAVRQDLDIALQLTPCGAVAIAGARRRVAELRDGGLLQPVWFQLTTGAAPANPQAGDADGVHVEFMMQGATVHQQMLPIRVVSAGHWAQQGPAPAAAVDPAGPGELPGVPTAPVGQPLVPEGAGPGLLARAAASAPPPGDQVRLSLSVDGSGLRVDLQHLKNGADWQSDSASPAAFDLAALASLGLQVRGALAASYQTGAAAWAAFDGQVNPADAVQQKAFRKALEAAAAAGSLLNQALRTDPDLVRLLDYIEQQVPQGARLTISTDQVFLPWELLTPQTWSLNLTPKQRSQLPPLDPDRFWGVRFAVETVPRRVPVGRRMLEHLAAAPRRVSVNVNPDIALGSVPPAGQPLAMHQAWGERLQNAGALDGDVKQSCDDMRAVLQDASQHASMVYLYCHGNSDAPFGGAGEQLVMDEDCALSPTDLAGPADYANAPIVFLNACESGVASPLAFSQFLRSFCERGALGLIATTHKVPIRFAAHFGPQCVDVYLGWRGSLAEMLRTLRQQHLALGNPVPLFYTVQCQLVLPS